MIFVGSLGICSEAKGLQSAAKNRKAGIHPFPPGHVQTYEITSDGLVSLLSEKQAVSVGDSQTAVPVVGGKELTLSSSSHANVCTLLKAAVRKRLMGGRRIGCLLSGGLDSSLIASIVVECIRDNRNGYTYKGDP